MVANNLSNNVTMHLLDLIGTLEKSIFFAKTLYKKRFSLYNSVRLQTWSDLILDQVFVGMGNCLS
jgi:hypothetical protein